MSSDKMQPTPSEGSRVPESEGEDGVERIADPDNYNLRRRLKQLHDAKERVPETKRRALHQQMVKREFTSTQRDRYVAEAVVDYIGELVPILDRNDELDSFHSDTIDLPDGGSISIEEFARNRGSTEIDGQVRPLPYQISMDIWEECTRYFERVAGAKFEQSQLPRQSGFNSVDEVSSQ